jgi:hypothetical protein
VTAILAAVVKAAEVVEIEAVVKLEPSLDVDTSCT